MYYIIIYQGRLRSPVHTSEGAGGRQPLGNLENFNSGGCKLYRLYIYIILYHTIQRSTPPARPPERWVQGAAAHRKIERFQVWELQTILYYIILYCIILYYTILYQGRPRLPFRAGQLQEFNSGSCRLYCILLSFAILYYTILYTRGSRGGSPLENCTISILGVVNYTVLCDMISYYSILYYTILY